MMNIQLLPFELGCWDREKQGSLLSAVVYSDLRPLRGVAGLADWRLCGQLSAFLKQERFRGDPGEKLLLATKRLPWNAIPQRPHITASPTLPRQCRAYFRPSQKKSM
jgi:hypothetical protein